MGKKQAEEVVKTKATEEMKIKRPEVSCQFEEKKIHYSNIF